MLYYSSSYYHSTIHLPSERPTSNKDSVLLVAVLVPVLSVVVVTALLVPVMVGGWRLWAKRCAFTPYQALNIGINMHAIVDRFPESGQKHSIMYMVTTLGLEVLAIM